MRDPATFEHKHLRHIAQLAWIYAPRMAEGARRHEACLAEIYAAMQLSAREIA
jgi:hypothetical protein